MTVLTSELIFNWVDRQRISLREWVAAYIGIVFVRCAIEAYSSPPQSGFIAADFSTLAHFFISYFAVFLVVGLIGFRYCGNAPRIWKILLFGFPIIWLSPCLDLLISGGMGYKINYIFRPPIIALYDFFLFLTPWSPVTPGLKIELSLIIVSCGLYVGKSRHSIRKGILASLQVYVALFLFFAIPSIIYVLAHHSADELASLKMTPIETFFRDSISLSAINRNSLHPTVAFDAPNRGWEVGFNHLMVEIYCLCIWAFGAIWTYAVYPEKFRALARNARPARVCFYLLFLVFGIFFAYARNVGSPMNWVDALSCLTLLLAWVASCMYAIGVNDIADAPIDRISNAGRPLILGTVTTDEMQTIGYFWLGLSLLQAWAVGLYPLYFNLIFTACYYVYSAPPLRLKRIPLLSSLLIAGAILSTVLAGFFFESTNKKFEAFPGFVLIGILIVFTLGVNMRDIKDIEGDRAEGVRTLPLLFGRYGRHVVGILFAVSFLVAPFVFHLAPIFWPSLVAAVLGYSIAVRQPFREGYVFALYFIYIAVSLAFLVFLPGREIDSSTR